MRKGIGPGLMLAALLLGAACAAAAAATAAGGWAWPADRAAPKLPGGNAMSAARVELGRRLFYDADLSVDGSMACSTCHVQRHAFADGNATHPGVHGDPGRRNVPGLANVAWAKSLTWGDPRVRTLEKQMLIPLTGTNPVEMGMRGREGEIAVRLGRDDCYVRMFRDAFPEAGGRIDIGTIGRALAAFQRSLISADTRYDRWLAGDASALDAEERQGARLFGRSCASCHAGPDLTDGRFHRARFEPGDRGLGEITGRRADDGRFRTPGLRNVMLTAPYLHDGSARTVAEAIDRHPAVSPGMAAADRQAIVRFLGALTDRAFVSDPRYALPRAACGISL